MQIWLASYGLNSWTLHASLIALAALGFWVWRNRTRDFWLLMGVTAVVARLWAYHRWYDDLLILFPLLALYRTAKTSQLGSTRAVVAGVLFALTLVSTLAPGGLYLLPPPWSSVYLAAQNVIWIAAMIFMALTAHGTNSLDSQLGRRMPSPSLPS